MIRRSRFPIAHCGRSPRVGSQARLFTFIAAVLLMPTLLIGADADAELLKSRAYQLSEQKQYEEAADAFQRYLEGVPGDTRAALDYASLLSQLNRHEAAAKLLEEIHQ